MKKARGTPLGDGQWISKIAEETKKRDLTLLIRVKPFLRKLVLSENGTYGTLRTYGTGKGKLRIRNYELRGSGGGTLEDGRYGRRVGWCEGGKGQ